MNNNYMKKKSHKINVLIMALLLSTLLFTSCEDKITYGWGDINESLGLLQDARNELQDEISDLDYEGYDTSDLEKIDERLKKVIRILDRKFY